jgi:hypothetical protein
MSSSSSTLTTMKVPCTRIFSSVTTACCAAVKRTSLLGAFIIILFPSFLPLLLLCVRAEMVVVLAL